MTIAADWFVYDPVDGVSFYAIEAEARDRAGALLEEERDDIDPDTGWNEHVSDICYGRVIGRVVRTKCEPAPEGSGFDEVWDFALKTVEAPHG
jgi:hypothetical protein